MSLSPLDISRKEFKTRLFGGYDKEEVNDFLDLVMDEMQKQLRQIQQLKEQVQQLQEQLNQYRTLEDTINRTLVAAQETADDIKANARKEAQLIIQEARLQAEKLIESGRQKASRILEENADLQRAIDALRTQLRGFLQSQLELLDRFTATPTPYELAAATLDPGRDEPPAAGSRPSWERETDVPNP